MKSQYIMTTLHLFKHIIQKWNLWTCAADIGVHKALVHYISKYSGISGIMAQIFQTLMKVESLWLQGPETSIMEKAHLVSCSRELLWACIKSDVRIRRWQVSGQRCTVGGALIPGESRGCYALFIVTEELRIKITNSIFSLARRSQ